MVLTLRLERRPSRRPGVYLIYHAPPGEEPGGAAEVDGESKPVAWREREPRAPAALAFVLSAEERGDVEW